jgi:hypothetical protein
MEPWRDEDFEPPPSLYPQREAFTATLFIMIIASIFLWGCWEILSALI